jgi:4'-phosphopantetheinyl transferase
MPLVKTIQIDLVTQVGIWHIEEEEDFFKQTVIISREIHNPHKRLQYFAARYLLKVMAPDFPVNEIKSAPGRKPFIESNVFHFSIAHSGEYAAAIISKRYRVGIDIEYVQPNIGKVAHKFLNTVEQSFISHSQPLLQQTVCWAAKEAVYKWHGEGGVDFKHHIHLQHFQVQPAGYLECHFVKDGHNSLLEIHYEIANEFCVAWVYSS